MSFFSAHPLAIGLALVSMVIWTVGNRSGNKWTVGVGVALSVAATVVFFLGM